LITGHMLITCCLCSQCVHHVPTGYLGPRPQCLPLALVVAPRANLPRFRLDIPGPPTSSSSPNRALFLPISSSSPSRALFPLASSSRPQRLLFSETAVIGCWRRLLHLVQVSLNSTLISLPPPHLELLPQPSSLSPHLKLSPSMLIALRDHGNWLLVLAHFAVAICFLLTKKPAFLLGASGGTVDTV
jgi:hypothetical protein